MLLLIIAADIELRALMKSQLKSLSGITSILESDSAEDALFIILEKEPQLIIASNILSGRSGFDLAYLLQKINVKSFFIILSNNPANAIDAIKAKVFDFLLYPFPAERLRKAVNSAMEEFESLVQAEKDQQMTEDMKVKLSVPNGYILADLNLLSHCLADGSYTDLYFTNGKVECSSYHLGKMEDILSEYQFVRITRSMIINMRMLKNIDEKAGTCKIDTGKEVLKFRITKTYVKRLAEKYFL